MSTKQSPIELACQVVGSQAALARILGVTPAMVNQLVSGSRPVPIEHCKAIEAATGKAVTCRALRPNDWQKIWPDSPPTQPQPAQPAIKTIAQEVKSPTSPTWDGIEKRKVDVPVIPVAGITLVDPRGAGKTVAQAA